MLATARRNDDNEENSNSNAPLRIVPRGTAGSG